MIEIPAANMSAGTASTGSPARRLSGHSRGGARTSGRTVLGGPSGCRPARVEPCVQQCYAIAGQWDQVLVVLSPDLAANRTASIRLFGTDDTVGRYETLLPCEAVKLGLELPMR